MDCSRYFSASSRRLKKANSPLALTFLLRASANGILPVSREERVRTVRIITEGIHTSRLARRLASNFLTNRAHQFFRDVPALALSPGSTASSPLRGAIFQQPDKSSSPPLLQEPGTTQT